MKINLAKDYEEMSDIAADIVIKAVKKKPNICLGLATGSTPVGLYARLVEAHKKGLDFSKVRTVNLDEYVGLKKSDKNSYTFFMNRHLFSKVNISENNVNIPDGMSDDYDMECGRYEMLLRDLKIDLQILGIGSNGHIAFNEPSENLCIHTHVVDLSQSTIDSNSRFFDSPESVPKQAISMGIGSIMSARKIILMASGASKREACKKLLSDDCISSNFPASILKLHKDVTLIIDKDAGGIK